MKRILSMTVAVVLALCMLPMATFAADSYSLGTSGSTPAQSIDLNTVRPNTSYRLDLQKNGAAVTRQTVRDDKLDVKVKAVTGNKVIDNVFITYDGDTAYVKVEFVQWFISTKEQDFEIQVYLTKNKSRLNETNLTIYGTMENYTLEVDSRNDYANIRDYPVIIADEQIREIEVDFDGGFSIIARMNGGKRYYGAMTRTPGASDEDIMNKYGDIEAMYALTTINLNGAGNKAKISVDDTYYVYNSGLEYIGTTNELLPYSTKYYLASRELEIDPNDVTPGTTPPAGEEPDDNVAPDADSNGNAGGIDGRPNPNTGVNGYANVAIVTGMISLAVAGAAALKKK